jgi:DNA-binding response OmpR family regulator
VYTTKIVASAAEAETQIAEWQPHLLVIDIDIDQPRTLALVGKRPAGQRLPTIVITRRGDLKSTLDAFERGADDLVAIPFQPEEFVARVLALMRRSYGDAISFVPVIKIAGLEIDLLNRKARNSERELELTAIEQALLYLLAANPGEVLSRDTILSILWGGDYTAESNIVDRHIGNLRLKLEDDWHRPRFIETVPGKGYRFRARQH